MSIDWLVLALVLVPAGICFALSCWWYIGERPLD